MKTLHTLEYDGHKCWFREVDDAAVFIKARKQFHQSDMCFLSHEPLSENGVVMVHSNDQLFPNCFINKSALGRIKEDWYLAIKSLSADYREAQKYAHWFV